MSTGAEQPTAITTVADACLSIDYGYTASAKPTTSGARFLRITDIQDSRVDWATVPGCDIDADDEASLGLADGDIVFARTGATTGKSFLIRNPPRAVFASYLIRLRVDPALALPDFVYLFFQSDAYWEQLRGFARGAAQPNVNATLLGQIEIPLPPLAEQERIAGRLTEQLAAVERARGAAQSRLVAADALPAAYLREVFEGPEASGWETVDHACLTIDYGHTASAKATASGPRFLRITDIQDSRVDWATVPGCDIDADDEASLGLADGDIVFARTGATTGKSFLIRNPPRAVFASYLIRLRVDPTVALPDFVYLFFQSDAYWEQLRGFARGAAQPNVNATLLGQIELPLPPLPDQRRIAADLAARLAGAERLAVGIRAELAAIEALPAALLREAFGGPDSAPAAAIEGET